MKTLISDNGGYQVYAELRDYARSNGNRQLRFITVWDNAKDPEGEQVKFEMILTPEQRKLLKEVL